MVQDIGAIVGFLFIAFFAYMLFGALRDDWSKSFDDLKGCAINLLAILGALVLVFWLIE